MDDLRRRFAALDRVAVPDLRPEVERRVSGLATRPAVDAVRPRVGWAAARHRGDGALRGRPFASVPVLLLLSLLTLAVVGSLTIGAGWWERRGVLVPPSTQPPRALPLTGDCPGAVDLLGDSPPFHGWFLGPEPRFLARPHPGRITALWREQLSPPIPPGATPQTQLVLVEVDPISRTMCRLLTQVRQEIAGLLDGASLLADEIAWTRQGDALALFRGGEGPDSCCPLGDVTVWWPGSHTKLASFDGDFGNVIWSNAGSWLAITRSAGVQSWAEGEHQTISVYPADGSAPREIRFACDPCFNYAAAFSPDDTRLAIDFWRRNAAQTDADQLVAVADIATGEGVVLDVGLPELDVIGWRDDETILAVDGGWRLLAIPVAEPLQFMVVAEFPVQLGTDGIWHRFSPDFSKVAYLRVIDGPRGSEWDVFVDDLLSGVTRHLGREVGTPPLVVWAPDNRTLAYSADIDPLDVSRGVTLKVADAVVGDPVSIGNYVSPVAWRPSWR
jgi:hypothetical protein